MKADVSLKGMKELCPCCGSNGPFRKPSKEEILAQVPEAGKYYATGIVSVILLAILIAIWAFGK